MRFRDAELPVGRAGLTLLVDREADRGRAVFAREAEHAVHALAFALAVLEVGRVEDRLAAVVLEAGFQDLWLGRVEHERQRRLGGEPRPRSRPCRACRRARRSRRTRRARARLLSPARAPSARRCPSRLRASRRGTSASRWRWCARRPRGTRAPGGTARASRSTSTRARAPACARSAARGSPRRSTTWRRCSGVVPQQPPTMLSPNSLDEALVRFGERIGREVVVRVPVDDASAAPRSAAPTGTYARAARGSGGARSSRPGPVAQFMPITSGCIASSAVSAAPISVPTSMRPVVSTVTCTMIGSSTPAARIARAGAVDRRLALEQVVDGLDEEHVGAARDQPVDLELVAVAQLLVGDLAERGQPRARDRSSRSRSGAGRAWSGPRRPRGRSRRRAG